MNRPRRISLGAAPSGLRLHTAALGDGLAIHPRPEPRLLAGSFVFVEAAAFRQVGSFSQELFAAEELDLSRRLKQLARETGRKIVILHRHPLKTSARKMRLYTAREHLRFFGRALFNQRRVLTSREAAHLWYDGRR
jgi:hypothetical protein